MLYAGSGMSVRQSIGVISSYQQQHYDEAGTAPGLVGRRSPRRLAGVAIEDPSSHTQPQLPGADRRPSPLHLDASRRSPRDSSMTAGGSRPGSGRTTLITPAPISPRDAAAIAAGADRRTTFASQKSFSYDVPSVEPPPQLHYRKQSEPIVGSTGPGQRQRQTITGAGRLLPRLPISGTQLEHHISQLMKYRGGAAGGGMNLSVDTSSGPPQLTADFVAELKELRRQISPSRKTTAAAIPEDQEETTPVVQSAAVGTPRRSPVSYDASGTASELQSAGRRQTFAGQKSLSYEVNQFVQYQPGTERLRDYLDENEIKEFEIEDADGTGVSVWVPPATLSGATTQMSRLSVGMTAGRRASRVGGQRRAHFAEQRSFSCEAASSSSAQTAATTHRGATQPAAGQLDVTARRYTRDSNIRLVRQSKTEAIDAAEMPTASSSRDSVTSRRRDRPPSAEAEPGGGTPVYRPRHHQTSEPAADHTYGLRSTALGYSDCDTRAAAMSISSSGVPRGVIADSTETSSRKPTRDMRPLERHCSMVTGAVVERDVDVASPSSGRRHTTGQVHDRRHADTAAAGTSKHPRHSRSPGDGGSYATERSRVLTTDVDKGTGADTLVEAHRKTSPRRVTVETGKDSERTRPTSATSQTVSGHAATYHGRRTTESHDRDRCSSDTTSLYKIIIVHVIALISNSVKVKS